MLPNSEFLNRELASCPVGHLAQPDAGDFISPFGGGVGDMKSPASGRKRPSVLPDAAPADFKIDVQKGRGIAHTIRTRSGSDATNALPMRATSLPLRVLLLPAKCEEFADEQKENYDY